MKVWVSVKEELPAVGKLVRLSYVSIGGEVQITGAKLSSEGQWDVFNENGNRMFTIKLDDPDVMKWEKEVEVVEIHSNRLENLDI